MRMILKQKSDPEEDEEDHILGENDICPYLVKHESIKTQSQKRDLVTLPFKYP